MFCLPLLTICIETLNLTHYKVKEVGVGWHGCFRKVLQLQQLGGCCLLTVYCGDLSFDYMLVKFPCPNEFCLTRCTVCHIKLISCSRFPDKLQVLHVIVESELTGSILFQNVCK